jgi:hypothetical protein
MDILAVPYGSRLPTIQAEVRSRIAAGLARPLRIELEAGVWELATPLDFSPADSGTATCPVTWCSAPGGRAVLSGGRRLAGWQVGIHAGRPAWLLDLPEVAAGSWWFSQLWVGGVRRPRTRLPASPACHDGEQRFRADEPFFRFAVPADPRLQQAGTAGFAAGDLSAAWRNPRDVKLVCLRYWQDLHLHLDGLDETGRLLRFSDPLVKDLVDEKGEGSRYFAENVWEALTTPGQWYLDRSSGRLTYLPLPDEDPLRTPVIAPRLTSLVRLRGETRHGGAKVRHLRLEHLDLLHAEQAHPRDYRGSAQAQFHLPGAVQLRGAEDCAVYGCRLAHLGGYALEVRRGSRANRIVGNAFHDLGAGAVKVNHEGLHVRTGEGGTAATRRLPAEDAADWEGEALPDAARPGAATLIAHNTITGCGRIFPSACAVWIGDAAHNVVLRNRIEDCYYTAISVGWTWGYGKTLARGNLIEGNLIRRIGQGLLSDMGAIYLLGVQPGTAVRGNWIEDVAAHGYGGGGIYPDEGSSFLAIEGNVVLRALSGAFTQHYGRDNRVHGNVFAYAHGALAGTARPERVRGFTATDNALLGSATPFNGQTARCRFAGNLAWNEAAGSIASIPPGVSEGDPGFLAPRSGDLRLRPGARCPASVPASAAEVGPDLGSALPASLDDLDAARLRPRPAPPAVSVRLEACTSAAFLAKDTFDADPQAANRYPFVDASAASAVCVVIDNADRNEAVGEIRLSWTTPDGAPSPAGEILGPDRLAFRLAPGGRAMLDTQVRLAPGCPGAWLTVTASGAGNDSALWYNDRPRGRLARLPACELAAVPAVLATQHAWEPLRCAPGDASVRVALCGDDIAVHATARDTLPSQGGQPWDGSVVEIFTALPGTNGRVDIDGRRGNSQIFLAPACAGKPPRTLCFANGVEPIDGIRIDSRMTADGWELWALIPAAAARILPDAPRILFEAAVSRHPPGSTGHLKTALFGEAPGHDNGPWMMADIS